MFRPESIAVFGNGVNPAKQGRHGVDIQAAFFEGDWGAKPPDVSILDPSGSSLDRCHVDENRPGSWNDILLELDARGQVVQCMPRDAWDLPTPGHDCICAELSRLQFGAGAADRKVHVFPRHLRPKARSANGRTIDALVEEADASDPTVLWAAPELPSAALAACFDGERLPAEVKIALHWSLDALGRVDSLEAEWDERASARSRQCAEEILRKARFTCPQGGRATKVNAKLRVRPSAR
jgi:hypothetical protein